ncbi:UNVERIFIED_CONTAM: alanine-tRNA synthetase second additional domain-containing protein [Prevotella sp. 15_C9]
MINHIQQYLISTQYFAPRGKERLIILGDHISQRHLLFTDRLIGIVGDAGSGKSSLIKGMFPGLELANDDDVINPRKIMVLREAIALGEVKESSSFHLDVRFLMGFLQMWEIAEFVKTLLQHNKRVIIEHFNLLHQALGRNADLLVGIGEEIIVARPSMFGPLPESIYEIVHESLKYRKMAHSAEEITRYVLEDRYGIYQDSYFFSDIRNGFVMKFYNKEEFDISELEADVKEVIGKSLPVAYYDEEHITIGDRVVECGGPRLQVRNTSEITDFSLVKELMFDNDTKTYCLIGIVDKNCENIENRNTQYFLTRDI